MNIRQTISRIVVGGWIVSSEERQKEEDGFDSYHNNNQRNTKMKYPTQYPQVLSVLYVGRRLLRMKREHSI